MLDPGVVACLTESVAINCDSDTSSWSDMCYPQLNLSEPEDESDDNLDGLFYPNILLTHRLFRKRHTRADDYLQIIESWSELEFKNRLRLSRITAFQLIDELDKSGFIASHKFGLKPLEPKICFYIFLFFITNTEPLTLIATRFDISVSSTFRVIRRVVAWLLTKLNIVIRWPQDLNDIKCTSEKFLAKTGIANMLGIIDCTHVRIKDLKNSREYCNPKGYFSIILQATIDSKLQFTNVFCGEPGSSNYSRVLKISPLYRTASRDRHALFPCDTFLVGHSGYPSLPWLVPPFRESKRLTSQQRAFNSIHFTTRKLSSKAFNLLKGRFRRIKRFTCYRNISFITDTIVAACILHNYCLRENDHIELE